MIRSLFIIRHGQTDFNVDKKILGQKDVVLNDNGIIESYKSVINLHRNILHNDKRFNDFQVISSPLKRAKFQAEIIADIFLKQAVFDDRLKERDWGDYTTNYKRIHKGELYKTPPNGESYADFQKRIKDLKDDILCKKEDVVIITHMGVIRELSSIFGLEIDHIGTGKILKILIDEHNKIHQEYLYQNTSLIYFFNRKIEPINIEKNDNTEIISYIKKQHKGQVRANGSPYYLHLLRVYSLLKKAGVEDEVVLKSALLHDIIEDTSGSYGCLIKLFNIEVADVVNVLTLDKDISYLDQKDEYISSIINYGYDSILVKLADLIDNLSDFEGISKKRQIKMIKKAQEILDKFSSSVILNNKELIFGSVDFKKKKSIHVLMNNLLFVIINRSMN